jgi:hypothetical protein
MRTMEGDMTRNYSSWEGAPAYQIYPATFNEFHEDPRSI